MRNEANIDIVGSNTFGRYGKQSSAETTNLFISGMSLVCYPGYKKVIEFLINGKSRGIFRSTRYDHLIVVVNNIVFSVTKSLSIAIIGFLETSFGAVYIAENNNSEIAMTDGNYIYSYNYKSKNFSRKLLDFSPSYLTFQDGYLIAPESDSQRWRLSDLNNALSWPDDPQHVGEISTKADTAIATIQFNRQLFVFGKKVTEIWHNVGSPIFPYQRNNAISIDYGCLNKNTIAQGFGYLVWLASNERSNASIIVSTGGNPEFISSDGLDFKISSMKNPSNSIGFIFQENGHIFYHITFLDDNYSLVYDLTTKKLYTATNENYNFHIAKNVVFFNGNNYFISLIDGCLYKMSSSLYTYDYRLNTTDSSDLNFEIPRQRITSPLIFKNNKSKRVSILNVAQESGASDSEQKIGLSVSYDGGYGYSDIVLQNMPRNGYRKNMVTFNSLGASNAFCFKFEWWGKSRFVILGASAEIF